MSQRPINQTWDEYLKKVRLEHEGAVQNEYLRVLETFGPTSPGGAQRQKEPGTISNRFPGGAGTPGARYTTIINGALEAFGEEKVAAGNM